MLGSFKKKMANSVHECADECFSQEPIVLKSPRKRDYDEIAENATRSTSCIDNKHPTLLVQQCWARCYFRLNRPLKQLANASNLLTFAHRLLLNLSCF